MGGRGAPSGADQADKYHRLLREISLNEPKEKQLADACKRARDQGTTGPTAVQHGFMESPESKITTTIDTLMINFSADTRAGCYALANITATAGLIPNSIKRCTLEVTLATQQPAGYPNTIASAGVGDGRIVVYGDRDLDRVTYVHESVHNYLWRNYSSPGSLERTPYDEAVLSEQPGPYPQGGQNLREDFAEAAALLILAPVSFSAAYPRRAAALRQILNIPVP